MTEAVWIFSLVCTFIGVLFPEKFLGTPNEKFIPISVAMLEVMSLVIIIKNILG